MTKPQKWMVVVDFLLIIFTAYVWLALVPEVQAKPVKNEAPRVVEQMGIGAKKSPSPKPKKTSAKPLQKPADARRVVIPNRTAHTWVPTLPVPSRTAHEVPSATPTELPSTPVRETSSSPVPVVSEPVLPEVPLAEVPEEEEPVPVASEGAPEATP